MIFIVISKCALFFHTTSQDLFNLMQFVPKHLMLCILQKGIYCSKTDIISSLQKYYFLDVINYKFALIITMNLQRYHFVFACMQF